MGSEEPLRSLARNAEPDGLVGFSLSVKSGMLVYTVEGLNEVLMGYPRVGKAAAHSYHRIAGSTPNLTSDRDVHETIPQLYQGQKRCSQEISREMKI